MSTNKVYIFTGSPGAGKTTYGSKFAFEHSATIIDIDTVSARLVEASLTLLGHNPDDRDSEFFKANFRDVIYETAYDLARANIKNTNVVIIGPFTKEIRDARWPEKLRIRLGTTIEIYYLSCSTETRRQRLIKRGSSRDKQKLANWDEYLKYYGTEARPDFEHVFIDTTTVSQ